MAATHPTMQKESLNVALVSAQLVTTTGVMPPRRELFLVFTDGTQSWEVRLQPTEVKSV